MKHWAINSECGSDDDLIDGNDRTFKTEQFNSGLNRRYERNNSPGYNNAEDKTDPDREHAGAKNKHGTDH